MRAESPNRPLIVAHRGLIRHAPENTLANFRACLDLRLGFEMDVRRTKDGKLVCIHDATVNRTTDGVGQVNALTLAEIQQLDAGSWFDKKFANERAPTIREILQLAKGYRQHRFIIAADLKVNGAEAELVAMAIEYGVLEKILFIGNTITDESVRARLRAASKDAQIAAVANNSGELEAALTAKNADWVYFRFVPEPQEMAAVRAKGKRSFIAGKTVAGRLPESWRRAAQVGIDAILTDYPLDLGNVLRRKRTPGER